MTKFSYIVTCIAVFSIAFSTPVAGQTWTLLIIPGVYFFWLHVKENGYRAFYKRKSQLFLLLFIFSIIFSNLINLDTHSDPIRGFKKIRYLLVCFFNLYTLDHLIKTIGTRKKAKLLANLLIYGFTVSTIYAYVSFYAKYDFIKNVPEDIGNRVTGITGIMNYGYEAPLVALFCLSIGFYCSSKEKLGLGLFNALGVLFSGTRGGVISVIAGLPLLVWCHFRRFFKPFVIVLAAALISAITAILFMDADFGRFSKGDASVQERLTKIEWSIVAFGDSPIYGHGLLSEKKQYPVITQLENETLDAGGLYICENTYLQVLVDMGLIGFGLYIAFMFFWIKETAQRNDVMTYLLLPSVIAFSVSSLVHTMFISGTTTAVLICFLYNFSVIDETETHKLEER